MKCFTLRNCGSSFCFIHTWNSGIYAYSDSIKQMAKATNLSNYWYASACAQKYLTITANGKQHS